MSVDRSVVNVFKFFQFNFLFVSFCVCKKRAKFLAADKNRTLSRGGEVLLRVHR